MFENFTDAHNTFASVTFERKSLISTVKGLKCECNNVSELSYVCVGTYACACSSACSCMCVCCRGACERMQACARRPEVRLWYCSSGTIAHFYFSRQPFSLTWNSLKQTRLARDTKDTVFISLPRAGIRSVCCHTRLVKRGFRSSNSDSYAYKALPTGQFCSPIQWDKRRNFLLEEIAIRMERGRRARGEKAEGLV